MKKTISTFWQKASNIKISHRVTPWLLLATLAITFGVFMPTMGFYQDDWHPVYYAFTKGVSSLWEVFLYDVRPFAAWPMVLTFPVLGFNPLSWHIFTLLLRWLTTLTVWAIFREIWPNHTRQVTWAAFLFAVYPLFKLQPLAVIYSQHWTAYLVFTLSILMMVKALRTPARFWMYSAISLALAFVHLFTIEYFAGAELIRPFILWVLLGDRLLAVGKRLWETVKLWLPYFVALVIFFVWRMYFIDSPAWNANQPSVIFDLFSAPIQTGIGLFFLALQEFVAIIISSLAQIFEPPTFSSRFFNRVLLIPILMLVGLFYLLLPALTKKTERIQQRAGDASHWYPTAFLIGIAGTILAMLPAWISNQGITINNPLWSDRFGMPAMFGASLVIVALLDWLVQNKQSQLVIFSLLLSFSIGWHIRYTNEYRWSWNEQTGFYEQLYWRAPALETNTGIITENELFGYMGLYPSSFAINSLYPQNDPDFITTWLFTMHKDFGSSLQQALNTKLYERKITSVFSSDTVDSLVISYQPELGQCLWVLRPIDENNRLLTDLTREFATVSNVSRISPTTGNAPNPFLAKVAPENRDQWCYYYQKADLARQTQDWATVVELWNESQELGYAPKNGVELMPFIEGFAQKDKWDKAQNLSLRSKELTRQIGKLLCATWDEIETTTIPTDERNQTIQTIRTEMACTP